MINNDAVSEEAVRLAEMAISMVEYKPSSPTFEYREQLGEAIQIAKSKKVQYPSDAKRIDTLLHRFGYNLSLWYNQQSRVDYYIPSHLIAMGLNIPAKRQVTQNEMIDENRERWEEIILLLEKLRNWGGRQIVSDNPYTLEKLHARLMDFEKLQVYINAANNHYRAKGTMAGFEGFMPEQVRKIDKQIKTYYSWQQVPFPCCYLTYNLCRINATRARIAALKDGRLPYGS